MASSQIAAGFLYSCISGRLISMMSMQGASGVRLPPSRKSFVVTIGPFNRCFFLVPIPHQIDCSLIPIPQPMQQAFLLYFSL